MIRWYDWVLAFILADLIQSFIFAGFAALTLWEPFVYGLIAGLIVRSWETGYCQFRLRQETENGQ